jgi:DNA invertase Pin-like site-specific DNA recombinase
MIYGYARVSTKDQNLDLQIQALKESGAKKIFTDQMSGATFDRSGLNMIFAGLRQGDLVLVWKLDRLARSVKNLIDLVKAIKEHGANFKSITDNIDTSTAAGQFFFHIMASLSEMERALIIERTQAGLQAAKKRGVICGRKRLMTDSKIINSAKLYAAGTPVKEIAKDLNVSVPTLYRALKNKGLE